MSHVRILEIDYKSLFTPQEIHHDPRRRRRSSPNLSVDIMMPPGLDLQSSRRNNSMKLGSASADFANPLFMHKMNMNCTGSLSNIGDLITSTTNNSMKLNKIFDAAVLATPHCDLPKSQSPGRIMSASSSVHFHTPSQKAYKNVLFTPTLNRNIVKPF